MIDSKVLLIEDNATDVLILKHALRKQYAFDHAQDVAQAKQLLESETYALMVCASDLSDGTAIDLLGWMTEKGIDVPVIVTAAQGDERVATEVLKLGAYDYLTKSAETLTSLPLLVRQAEQRHALEREARRLQQIVENASDCIITMDMDGNIQTANQATKAMLGYRPDEVIGQPFSNLFVLTKQFHQRCESLKKGGADKSSHCELQARQKDGAPLTVDLSVSVLRERTGKPVCLIGIARDMTERNQLMAKLQRLSTTDNLTTLSNHRFFHDRLHYEYARSRRYNHPLGCIMIDVDYFKTVNDTYGHVTGDGVLRSLGARILAIADAYDAMTSERSFSPAVREEDALGELLQNAGTQFDPKLVHLFLKTRQHTAAT